MKKQFTKLIGAFCVSVFLLLISTTGSLAQDCTPPDFEYAVVNDCPNETYTVTATLNDFGTSSFITIYLTRSDEVPVNNVTLPSPLVGQTVNIITNIPFGVTVDATISGSDPTCDLTSNFEQEYCHIDGEVCDAPIVVSELPYNDEGNTADYLDDYEGTDVPPVSPNAIISGSTGTYYLNGDDVVYSYTSDEDGAIDIALSNTGTYASLWVFTGCPFDSTMGYDNQYPAGSRAVPHLPVIAGTTYYIVISTWPAPQTTDYTLDITVWEDCAGVPSAGTIDSDMIVCAATPFTLEATDVSADANGLLFTWQSSPAGEDNWTDIDGANTNPYTVAAGVGEATDFRLKAHCDASDETTYSNVLAATINPNYTECYCTPTYTYACTSNDLISNVSLTGESMSIDNSTGCSAGNYSDYSDSLTADLAPGESYYLSVSTIYGTPTSEQVIAWIDYNLNGAFEANEEVANTAGAGLPGGTDSFDFVVPEGLAAGNYRLRVRMVYSSAVPTWNACDNQSYGETEDYMVEIIDLDACTGTPEAGVADTTGFSVCAGIDFSLSVSGASDPADGLERIWQSSPAGADTWTDIAGATSSTYSVDEGIQEPTDFRYKVTCSYSSETDYSDVVQVGLNPAVECYCIPTNTYSSSYYISNVSTNGAFQNLNQSSGFTEGGYADYTDTDTLITYAGQEFDISLSYGGSGYTYQLGIWIDLNQNGNFTDANETIVLSTTYMSSYNGSIVIPDTLLDGNYRVRIRASYIGAPTPCGDSNYAEAEDYIIQVITLDDCAGTPTGGTVEDDSYSVCAGTDLSLVVVGASVPANGLERIWQSSPAGEDYWTDIPEAISTNYTVVGGIDVPTDFRYRVTCTISEETAYSNVVQVGINPALECYCTPSNSYSASYYISNVSTNGALQDLDRTSGFTAGGYADYTDTDTLITYAGQEFDISLSYGGSGLTYQLGVWVDLNQNGSFTDANETIILSTTYASSYNGSIVVPDTLLDGSYRVRIRASYIGAPSPCGDSNYAEAEDYVLKVITLNECAGTPTAGTVEDDSFNVCAGNDFSLVVMGSSEPANGLERIWQSSPAGEDNWTDIPEATSTSYTVVGGIDVPTDFRYRVTCTNSEETVYSNVVQVGLNPALECYCIPSNSYSTSYYISNVSTDGALQDLDRTSGFTEGGYADYTDTDTLIAYPSQEFDISLSYGSGTYQLGIWVDLNQNGSFADANETIILSTTYAASYNGSITIPEGLPEGNYRMRIRASYIGAPAPCGDNDYAEAEDYIVSVVNLDVCSGTPSAGTADLDQLGICPNAPFTLSVTGASEPAGGLVRIWQSSTDDGATWTDIPGATSPIYVNPGISELTQFRYSVTCTNSDETDVSNVIETSFNPANACYCVPVGTNNARYIDNFSTTDAIQNVTNENSGFSTGGYGDFTSMTVEQAVGGTVSFSASFQGGTFGFRIWVDWNQDGSFDTDTEVAYQSSSYLASQSGSFEVPSDALAGTTRMRVVCHWLSTTGSVDPCVTGFTYGEFEDYAFEVDAAAGGTSLGGSVTWNSACGERDAVVSFYEPGTATLVADYPTTIGSDGTFNIEDVEIGTFDVIVDVEGYLAKGVEDVYIVDGENSLALGAIVRGDINGDGFVNFVDFSIVNAAFGSVTGNANFNPLADLNCSGTVDFVDVSFLNAAFGQMGDSAPLGQ